MATSSSTTAKGKKEQGAWVAAELGEMKKAQEEKPVNPSERSSRLIPLSLYWLKDVARELISYKHFADSMAISFALLCLMSAFNFYPVPIALALLIVLFAVSMVSPQIGIIALLFIAFPAVIYQGPLLAWVFMAFMTASLFLIFPHYRTVTFVIMLVALPFSHLGLLFELPVFVIMTLAVGFKRAAAASVVILLLTVALSGLIGVQPSGPIAYNATKAWARSDGLTGYLVTSSKTPSIGGFVSAWSSSFGEFVNAGSHIFEVYGLAATAVAQDFAVTLVQAFAWLLSVFVMCNFASKSRSLYRGAKASLFSVIIPTAYFLLSYLPGQVRPLPFVFVSFVITPVLLAAFEAEGIEFVRVLEVMKMDVLGKFGELMEDLSTTTETFADVADYESIKRELTESVLAPIEHRELASAYGVKPAKGILLFGPPGTGKTLIMRALANEIRGGFYYIKASSIIRPYPGEGSLALSKIFSTARKNTPSVLFIDEIDSIARKRSAEGGESTELLSTLLSEMDGFEKISGVVMVGATNAPQLLDPALTRPGRFDKAVYVPLPDKVGRELILKHYFAKLPIGDDIDFGKLADMTNRFSGADLKNLADETARSTSEEALSAKKVLRIGMREIVAVLRSMKPSTSLAQIEDYNTFKTDFERRLHPGKDIEEKKGVKIADVVGLEDAKKAMFEAIEMPILHPDLVKKYDIENVRCILLFGPPGTGKTMLVTAVANELGDVKVLVISGYEISKYGVEKALATIKSIFDRAKENIPSLVFIDEIDALVPARDSASAFGSQLTGEFLEEFDKLKGISGVVVVAATNRPDTLDPALLRAGRFDHLIFVPPPDEDGRADIFRHNLERAPLSKDIDFAALAKMTAGYTGADIANICRQIKLDSLEQSVAGKGEVQIGMQDLSAMIKSTRPSSPASLLSRYRSFLSTYGQR